MSDVIVGLVGVLAGSVGAGTVQSVMARGDRRLEARASSRSMHSVAIRAAAAVQALEERQHWAATELDWERFNEQWSQHSGCLARVLPAHKFAIVDNWFSLVDKLARVRVDQLAQGITAPSEGQLRVCTFLTRLFPQTRMILWDAGLTYRERRTSREPELPAGP